MKTLLFAFFFFFLSKSAWYDALEEGAIEGYMTPENASSFLTSFSSNKFKKALLGTTVNNNQLNSFSLTAKSGSKSSNSTILITASHTTTQPLATTMALYLAGSLSQESSDQSKFLRNYFSIIILPMVNIDAFYNMTNENNTLSVFLKNFQQECG
jgi:murein tripeptide amidase MpaA